MSIEDQQDIKKRREDFGKPMTTPKPDAERIARLDKFLMSRNGSFPNDNMIHRQEAIDFADHSTALLTQEVEALRADNERLRDWYQQLSRHHNEKCTCSAIV